jgi:hypothetical protein
MQFHTGLIALDYFEYPEFPYHGNGWSVGLAELPEPLVSREFGGEKYPGKEVVITASTEAKAQRAADLIHSSFMALDGSTARSRIYQGEHAAIHFPRENASDLSSLDLGYPYHSRLATSHIPMACLVAARASKRLRFVYAISKLRISLDTFSLPITELDPEHHRENVPKSALPEDHVRYAFAIVAAWSCIEELGFDVRASQQNPTKIKGVWNPAVKSELERRLRRGHINLKERCLWHLRGPRTRIEIKRAPEIVKAAEWVRHLVRDGEIEVIDAINYVSFLRSKLTAHRLDHDTVKLLSVYDVGNAQLLARRLLLETVGFWRHKFRMERVGQKS